MSKGNKKIRFNRSEVRIFTPSYIKMVVTVGKNANCDHVHKKEVQQNPLFFFFFFVSLFVSLSPPSVECGGLTVRFLYVKYKIIGSLHSAIDVNTLHYNKCF